MPTEKLVSCPDCGLPNFTVRGLPGHRRSKHCTTTFAALNAADAGDEARAKVAEDANREMQGPETLGGLGALGANLPEILRPVSPYPPGQSADDFGGQLAARVPAGALTVDDDVDTTLGLQLTVEYERAVGGMRSVLTFGAMMMQLRERLNLPARGQVGGKDAKGCGLEGWLTMHAPAIKRQTAQRLEEVAKGVALEYEKIVGTKCAKQFSLAALVTTPAEDLPEGARLKQLDLFAFVDGTSQRSWLDKLKPHEARGGDTSTKGRALTPEEQQAKTVDALHEDCMACFRAVDFLGPKYRILNDPEVETGIELLRAKADEMEAWLKTPKAKRPVLDAVKALLGEAH